MKPGRNIFNYLITVWILLIFISSCSKKSEDVNSGNGNNGKPGVITVPGTIGTDTVITHGYFEVDIAADTLINLQLDVVVEGVLEYTHQSKYHQFLIPVATFGIDQGIYKTVLNAYSLPTGSTSFKKLLATKSIILIYIKDPLPFTPDLTFLNSRGTLVCQLNTPALGKPVTKILVEKSVGPVQQFYPLYSITGSSPFIFSDTTYVGEKADFRITTYFSNEEKTYFFPKNTGVVQKAREPMPVSHTIDNNGYPLVQWPKTNYPANCKGYRIFSVFPGVKKEVETLPSVEQTTYTLKEVAFPGITKAYVSVIPKGPPPYYNNDLAVSEYSGMDTATAGIPWPAYWYFYSPVGEDFFTVHNEVITGYSVATLAVTHQVPPPGVLYCTGVSPNNKYLLAYTGINSGYHYLLYHIPTKTLIDVPANLVDPGLDMIVELAISDNGIGVMGTYFGEVIVYDFLQNKLLGVLPYFDYPRPEVSPNGDYFFILDAKLHLYKNDNGTITEVWKSQSFDGYYLYYSFLPWDGTKAVIIQDNVCSVKNAADWSLIRSFPVDFTGFENADFNRGTILGRNDQYLQIVDFNSGNVLRTIYSNDPYSGYVKHSGSSLFCGNGRRLVIPR
ncbi:MAG: hypothetical protein ACOYNC_18315 [Bacteroidales bacterium]